MIARHFSHFFPEPKSESCRFESKCGQQFARELTMNLFSTACAIGIRLITILLCSNRSGFPRLRLEFTCDCQRERVKRPMSCVKFTGLPTNSSFFIQAQPARKNCGILNAGRM